MKKERERMNALGAGILRLWTEKQIAENRKINAAQLAREASVNGGPVSPGAPWGLILGRGSARCSPLEQARIQAYLGETNVEISRHRRISPMRDAALEAAETACVVAATWLQWWLNQDECDCGAGGHICGRPKRQEELRNIDEALARVRAALAEPAMCEWVLEMDAPSPGGGGSWHPGENEGYFRSEIQRLEVEGWSVKRFEKRDVGPWRPADD